MESISELTAIITTIVLASWGVYKTWRTQQAAQRAQPIINQAPPSLQPDLAKLRIAPALLQIVVDMMCRLAELEALVLRIPELERQIEEKNAEIARLKMQRDSDQKRIAELEAQVADLQRRLSEAKGGSDADSDDVK